MKSVKLFILMIFAAALVSPFAFTSTVESQAATEAPRGFDTLTNGFSSQTSMDAAKEEFEGVEGIAKGLGPVYNAQSCKECHQNPVTGGISQITELRAGHNDASNNFVDAPGGSLINDRGIPTPNFNGNPNKSAKVQERVPPLLTAAIIPGGSEISAEEPVRTFRTSLNVLGDGFVEILPNGTLWQSQMRNRRSATDKFRDRLLPCLYWNSIFRTIVTARTFKTRGASDVLDALAGRIR